MGIYNLIAATDKCYLYKNQITNLHKHGGANKCGNRLRKVLAMSDTIQCVCCKKNYPKREVFVVDSWSYCSVCIKERIRCLQNELIVTRANEANLRFRLSLYEGLPFIG